MSSLPALTEQSPPSPIDAAHGLTLTTPPSHSLGPVADDWAAIEVWLAAVASNSRRRGSSDQTVNTYRFHLAKVRWYCDTVLGRTPARWDTQDVLAFEAFIANLPDHAVCADKAKPHDEGYTPFRKRPVASSQSDIMRFLQALFKALHSTGYLRANPMALMTYGKARRLDTTRAIDLDLFHLVLEVMDARPRDKQKAHQIHMRDRFIFICLRESGLRASELVGARMRAVQPLSDPKNRKTYWILKVDGATAKGGKERTVPMTPALLDALIAYRSAFGLAPLPGPRDEDHGLILSVRTRPLAAGAHGGLIRNAADRRYFGAWRDVGTRFGLHGIVKGRVRDAVAHLEAAGRTTEARELERVSSHWMRHTFATAALLAGKDIRVVAAALGHASVTTTMVYTEQGALDQIRNWEGEQPGSVAQVAPSLDTAPANGNRS